MTDEYVYRIYDTENLIFRASGGTSIYSKGRTVWANKSGAVNAKKAMIGDSNKLVIKKYKLVEVRDDFPIKQKEQISLPGKFDNKGKSCLSCKQGVYKETSIVDDWTGVLHCSVCGVQVERWI